MGDYEYEGVISASVKFEYFPFAPTWYGENTFETLRAVYDGFADWELSRELNRLGVREEVLERPFQSLSKGEQTKVLLAVLFLKENRFLLIDEPTNHLDAKGRELTARYLAEKKGFLLVSHDRAFLDIATDHTLAINKAGIEVQSGNFSSWYQNRQQRDLFEAAQNERLQKEIRRLEESAAQAKGWADAVERTKIGGGKGRSETKSMGSRAYIGEKSRRMQQRRKNLERSRLRAAEEKAQLLHQVERQEELCLRPLSYHKELLAEGRELSLTYQDTAVFEHVDFRICRGERISLQGCNGSGKSSILRLLAGEEVPVWGDWYRASGLKISYLPQDSSSLRGSIDTYAARYGIDRTLFQTVLRKLDFSRAQFEKNLEFYSEGQKKKVLIARSLCEQAHFYVWDEPLNYIDLYSRMQIEELLLKFEPTLLFVEHDRAFCERIATRTLEMTNTGNSFIMRTR